MNNPSGCFSNAIQKINISADIGREQIFELGKTAPYFRFVNFPTQVNDEVWDKFIKDVNMIDSFTGTYSFLSNFYPSQVQLGGYLFPSVEHAFQAAKSFDIEERLAIRKLKTAAQAKRAGKQVKLRTDWQEIKLSIMEDLVRQKFTQHVKLQVRLLQTGDSELIEGNWWNDTFWGVCNGVGENHLGKILMKVRKEINETI